MNLDIKMSKSDLRDLERTLNNIRNGSKKALTKALNGTASTTKVQIRKKLGQKLNLKASRINEDLSVEKANYSKPSACVRAVGAPVGLINFAVSRSKNKVKARQHDDGVAVRIYKGGKTGVIKHGFIASTKAASRPGGSKEHLFRRQYKGPRKPYNPDRNYAAMPKKYRLPVERLTGPRIEDVLAKDETLKPIEKDAADLLTKNLDKETEDLLRRAKL